MAGTYEIDFHFRETVAIAPDYEIKPKPYDASATEIVVVVEDTPERIILQHLLVVNSEEDEPRVIKHWGQVWTWQDTHILDYSGEDGIHEWKTVTLSAEEAAGTWSQLVTQTDDTPRYEGYGRWIHQRGESYWESSLTRRPLPRREYTKRDDYDYLLVTNRQALTKDGWVHMQDNRKVVDRGDEPSKVLTYEIGLNTYTVSDSEHAAMALNWWKKHGPFWDDVRDFWLQASDAAPAEFSYTTYKDGKSLSQLIKRLADEHTADADVSQALRPFVIAK